MIIFFIALILFNFLSVLEPRYQSLKKTYEILFEKKDFQNCPKNLRKYFEKENLQRKCLPPRTDHSFKEGRNGAEEVICLLLEKAQVKILDLKGKEKVICNFHQRNGPY